MYSEKIAICVLRTPCCHNCRLALLVTVVLYIKASILLIFSIPDACFLAKHCEPAKVSLLDCSSCHFLFFLQI